MRQPEFACARCGKTHSAKLHCRKYLDRAPRRGESFCTPPTEPKQPRSGQVTAIDLFAGAGGFTIGAERAGAHVLWAINHFPEAIATHMVNHPHVHHCCEDVFEFDWRKAPVPDIVLASPSCKSWSQVAHKGASGDSAGHDVLRCSPAAIGNLVDRFYEEDVPSPILVIENVDEWRTLWRRYGGWKKGIEDSGYTISEKIVEAFDFGAPQFRKRLFLVCIPERLGTTPFGIRVTKRDRGGRQMKGLPPEQTIGPGLLRDYPSPGWTSLDKYKPKAGNANPTKFRALVMDQHSRITKNLGRKVPPYWVFFNLTSSVNPRTPDMPMRTITSKLGGQAYVIHSKGKRHWIRMVRPSEWAAWMGFPLDYHLPNSGSLAGELIGNAVCPQVSEGIVRQLIERA